MYYLDERRHMSFGVLRRQGGCHSQVNALSG